LHSITSPRIADNAIKYSPDGSLVSVETESDNEEIRIKVIDHGPGFPKRHQARLFERFYRVDRARSRMLGGTVLGLSTVKLIAQAHGGNISVKSTPGRGSTFCIALPVKHSGENEKEYRLKAASAHI
jgi:signal transduction histidine kinase